jgi:BMFP domain-containing protein YqiC
MPDMLDRMLLVAMGLEKKVKEVIDDLQKTGKEESGEEGLSAKEVVENKIVDEGVGVVKELLSVVDGARKRIEEELASKSGRIREKIHAADSEEIEVVKEMARLAREKVDALEKRVDELEALLKKKKK